MAIRAIALTVGSTPVKQAITWSYPNDDGKMYVVPTYHLTASGTDDAAKPMSRTFEVIRFGISRSSTTKAPHVVGLVSLEKHAIQAWLPNYKVHSFDSKEKGAWQVYGNFLIHDGPDKPMEQAYASIGCIEICGGPSGFDVFNDFLLALSGSKKETRQKMLSEIGASKQMTITYLPAVKPPLKEKK